ncbi:MAG: GDSL-type esterase/lipase family protein [Candidatus Methylacidiphilales bacterium]|nr:GDSL-type esterase/lipase family protein [Candidatus Methylacidiphilales bacterium]
MLSRHSTIKPILFLGSVLLFHALSSYGQSHTPAPAVTEAKPLNNAIFPMPNIQKDNYKWQERRDEKVKEVAAGNHDLIFIGDSITHRWEKSPVWIEHYGKRNVLNLGYGWDCTQNVLWRLQNGEFVGQKPKLVVLNIGTNNMTGNSGGRANSPEEIVEGIQAILRFIKEKSPDTSFLVMGIFPRGLKKDATYTKAQKVNELLKAALKDMPKVELMDIGSQLVDADGEIPKDIMGDRVHPSPKGYEIWAAAIEPVIKKHLGE